MNKSKERVVFLDPTKPRDPRSYSSDVLRGRSGDGTQALLVMGPVGSGKSGFIEWVVDSNGRFFRRMQRINHQDNEAIAEVARALRNEVDTLIVEPAGDMHGDVMKFSFDRLEIPSNVITLVDVAKHQVRKSLDREILDSQLKVADAVGLTWWGDSNQAQIDQVREYVGLNQPKAKIIQLNKLDADDTGLVRDHKARFHQRLLNAITNPERDF